MNEEKRRRTDSQNPAVEVNSVSHGLLAHGENELYPLLKCLWIQLDILLDQFTLEKPTQSDINE